MLASQTTKRHIIVLSLVLVSVFILSTEARAETFGFFAVTNNDTADAAAGEAQLTVDIFCSGGGNSGREFPQTTNLE